MAAASSKVYKDSDFVKVVDANGVESEVPKAWVGTDLLPEGTKKASTRSSSSSSES